MIFAPPMPVVPVEAGSPSYSGLYKTPLAARPTTREIRVHSAESTGILHFCPFIGIMANVIGKIQALGRSGIYFAMGLQSAWILWLGGP